MSFGYVPCPADALTPPPPVPNDWAQSARMNAGLVIGGIDWVIKFLTGESPLEKWVFKPLAGNWGELDRGAAAWSAAGRAMSTLKDNMNAVKANVGDQWQGQTADAFLALEAEMADNLSDLPSACDEASEMVSALSEAAQAIAEMIATGISELASLAGKAIASLGVPGVGEAAQLYWQPRIAVSLAKWTTKITKAFKKFAELAEKLTGIAKKIYEIVKKIAKIVVKIARMVEDFREKYPEVESAVTIGISAANAGSKTLDAAQKTLAWDGV
ncbi:hypothetical protein ET495_01560 [Xylanimonas allomyrinae]|uniref:WXG100 family type VII secretion target n=1 Tax=Xylanimonas allomyrinae TaxID=2509459 RepID=A0A4P6EVX3_9MICO|nr:hypothetical protein [Xylanimonas allomyrinae]QAY62178.1 hypothetical protein ET495_01560 [Xylanimonas allomyrinae]